MFHRQLQDFEPNVLFGLFVCFSPQFRGKTKNFWIVTAILSQAIGGDLGVAGSQRLCFWEKEFLGVWFSYSMVGRPLVSVNVLLGLTEHCKIAMNLTNKQYKASCKKNAFLFVPYRKKSYRKIWNSSVFFLISCNSLKCNFAHTSKCLGC